jgi:hypothetical protein
VERLQAQYDELPAILRVLPMFKGGLWGTSDEAKVTKGKGEAPVPLNVHCVDVIDLVAWLLDDIGGLRIADLIRHEHGVARALLVGAAWNQADGIIGISRKQTRRFAKCPGCDTRNLAQYAGSDTIFCTNCDCRMTADEYSAGIIAVG